MSVYQDRKDALEEHEFRMGLERGRLAGLTRLADRRSGTGRAAWRLLPKRPPAGQASHGHSDDQPMSHRCERAGDERNDGTEGEERRLAQERIPFLLAPNGRIRPMSWDHRCIVRQSQQLVVDGRQDQTPVPARQIGASYAVAKECVSGDKLILFGNP